MAKDITKVNVTDQVSELRKFSKKNPYGRTFIDEMMLSLMMSIRTSTKNLGGEKRFIIRLREDLESDPFGAEDDKVYEVNNVKHASMLFYNLGENRRFISGDQAIGGYIPVNEYDIVSLTREQYNGDVVVSDYKLVLDDDRIMKFYHTEEGCVADEPEYELDMKKITSIRIDLINEFEEARFFSGFVNSLKSNITKNCKESDEFMISECVYNFILMMYRNFKINFRIDVKNEVGCYKLSTSLFTNNAFFSDLVYRHQYLYDLNHALVLNSYYIDRIDNTPVNRVMGRISMFNDLPIDLSWALFDETKKLHDYIKTHYGFFLDLAKRSLNEKSK